MCKREAPQVRWEQPNTLHLGVRQTALLGSTLQGSMHCGLVHVGSAPLAVPHLRALCSRLMNLEALQAHTYRAPATQLQLRVLLTRRSQCYQ